MWRYNISKYLHDFCGFHVNQKKYRRVMSKRQNENRKPISKKAQFVVPCVKYGSIEKVEKLQNKETVKELYLSTVLAEQNRTFLEERSNKGTMDDLVSLFRAVWDNSQLGQLITLVDYSAQGIDHPTTKADRGDC
jgi:hypothetical protein